jgi:hypothetical protein
MRAKGAWQTLALVLTVYTGTVGASCGNGRCDAQDYYACPQECASRTPPAPCPAAFGSLSQVEQDCIVKYATTYGCLFQASTRFSLPSSHECASVVGNTSCVFDWCFNACLSANACFEPAPTPACVPHCTTQSIGRISNGSAGAPLHCSPSCNSKNVGDGVCNLACMTKECYFDGGDCLDVAHISMPTSYNSNLVSSTLYWGLSSVTIINSILLGSFNTIDWDSDGLITGAEYFGFSASQSNYSFVPFSDEQISEFLYMAGDENRDGKIDTAEWLHKYIYYSAGSMPSIDKPGMYAGLSYASFMDSQARHGFLLVLQDGRQSRRRR